MDKIKVSYHSGKGYALHNNHYLTKRDRGNINHDLTPQNKIWTCIDGVTDLAEAEKELYNQMFTEELEQQNNKYRKKGNYDRVRTMDEWMESERHRPVENIFQIGNMECYIDSDDLWDCYLEFVKWREDRFKGNLVLISATMHVDEATPHIHDRYVWYWIDENGVKHTGVKKSLEQAGVELPDPSAPEGRYNYRKMTFDAMCREKWQDIVEKVLQQYQDLELDRTVDEERKKNRIGHMGVDAWREFQRAFNSMRKKVRALSYKEEELKEKEEMLRARKEKLEHEAIVLKAAAEQHTIKIADFDEKMEKLKERETELAAQERAFKRRVDETVQRRLDAHQKLQQMADDYFKNNTNSMQYNG